MLLADLGPKLSSTPAANYGVAGSSNDMALAGNRVYIADGANGIRACAIAGDGLNCSSAFGIAPTEANGSVNKLELAGNRLYAAEANAGVGVYDISTGAPTLLQRYSFSEGAATYILTRDSIAYIVAYKSVVIAELNASGEISSILSTITRTNNNGFCGLALSGNGQFLYATKTTDGILGFDISDPANPIEIFHLDASDGLQYAREVVTVGNYVLVATFGENLKKYVIANDGNLSLDQTITVDYRVKTNILRVLGNYVFVGSAYLDEQSVQIIDISNPADMRYIGSINDLPDGSEPVDKVGGFIRLDNMLFMTTGTGVIERADISQPYSPVRVGSIDVSDALNGGDANGTHLFITDANAGLLVFDITDPRNPIHIATKAMESGIAYDAVLNGTTLYIANGTYGLSVYNVANPSNPIFLNHYIAYGVSGINYKNLSFDREKGVLFVGNLSHGTVSYRVETFPHLPTFVNAQPLAIGSSIINLHAKSGYLYAAENGGSKYIVRWDYNESGVMYNKHTRQFTGDGNNYAYDVTTVTLLGGEDLPVFSFVGVARKLHYGIDFNTPEVGITPLYNVVGLSAAGQYLLGSSGTMSAYGLEIHYIYEPVDASLKPRFVKTQGKIQNRAIISGNYAYIPDHYYGVQAVYIEMLRTLQEAYRSVDENATLESLSSSVSITFSQNIDPSSLIDKLYITRNGAIFDDYVYYQLLSDNKTVSFTPYSGAWIANSEYQIHISGDISDIFRNPLGDSVGDELIITFRTE